MNLQEYRNSQIGLLHKQQKISVSFVPLILKEENTRRRRQKIKYWSRIWIYLALCGCFGMLLGAVLIYFGY